jgi:hypothetical protein
MSAERAIAWLLCGICLATAAQAGEEEAAPDAEFLEYLGMWDESDEDWVLLDDTQVVEMQEMNERSEPAPEGEDSSEKTDES